MLLHNRIFRSGSAIINLQSSDRAPLNLTDGSVVHVEPPRRPVEGRPLEMFVSAFAPETWNDIWHLELSFSDQVGVITSLFELLQKFDVVPIAAETCTFAAGDHHKAVIVCDCRNYSSEMDGDQKSRCCRELAELQGLRALVAAEFLEDLVFTNGMEPHLRLVRNVGHFRAFKRLQLRHRDPQVAVIEHGGIPLPQPIIDHIRETTLTDIGDLDCLVISDSSDRCLRLFLSDRSTHLLHVHCVTSTESSALATSVILSEFQRRNFDTLGCRVQKGESQSETGRFTSTTQLDLFLRPPNALLDNSMSQIAQIIKYIETDLCGKVSGRVTLELGNTRTDNGRGDSKSNPDQTIQANLVSN